MGKLGLVRKLIKIDNECKKNDELRNRVEPLVKKMEGRPGGLTLVKDFISEFERIKKEINDGIRSDNEETGCVSKIKSINER